MTISYGRMYSVLRVMAWHETRRVPYNQSASNPEPCTSNLAPRASRLFLLVGELVGELEVDLRAFQGADYEEYTYKDEW